MHNCDLRVTAPQFQTVDLVGYRLVVNQEQLSVAVFKISEPGELVTRLQGHVALQQAVMQHFAFALFLSELQPMFARDARP